jgi:hypothetical protein
MLAFVHHQRKKTPSWWGEGFCLRTGWSGFGLFV